MRKNVKKQLALRVLSTAALVAMVSSIATAAFADTYDLNKGSVDILAEGGKQYITQWKDESKSTYATDDNGEIKKRPDDDITLTTKNKDTGETETTSNTVTITAENKGDTANVTLKDVHIETESSWNNSGSAPIEIKGNGDTNLELNGDNTVLSGDRHHAAIEKADKNGTGTLTIKDDLNDDNSTPKDKDENGNAVGGDTGKLLAGGYGDGAGIGGGYNDITDLSYANTSNITIKGGEITARGGYEDSAGIGGGTNGNAKNIRIEGNAHVTASGDGGAGIGGGTGGNDVTITGNAVVDAYSEYGSAIGDGRPWGGGDTTITISGNATVHAEGKNGTTAIGSSQNGHHGNLTITIAENANVTAIGSTNAPAIGNAYSSGDGNTTIRITGGTVNAINSYDDNKDFRKDYPAIGAKDGKLNLTIDGSTGDTVVNAYQNDDAVPDGIGEPTTDPETGELVYGVYKIPTSADYNEDGSSNLGEKNSVVINYYKNASVIKEELQLPDTLDESAKFDSDWNHHCTITGGTLTKVVHNRKYMEEHPEEIVDITKLKDEDLHDWQLVGKVVEPTLEKDGYADYICSIDKCGQTKHVVLPKLTPEPSEPDVPGDNTPNTPNKPDTPKQPDGTTPAPVTPDAPVQDSTAPADTPAADITATAQNVVQDAKPEAAAAASTAAPAAAVLPQTGANWLAVVGTALSGMFLLAAGFVLDRKNRRMN